MHIHKYAYIYIYIYTVGLLGLLRPMCMRVSDQNIYGHPVLLRRMAAAPISLYSCHGIHSLSLPDCFFHVIGLLYLFRMNFIYNVHVIIMLFILYANGPESE